MTRIVSVVTAVHCPSMKFLPDAYASLANQRMPSGWDWQWLVQEDGTSGQAQAVLGGDSLDSDDVLAPGALARDIAVLSGYADVGWTTCRVWHSTI